ncbi:MAG: glycosyltransferase [Acidimicrobiia bacterium]
MIDLSIDDTVRLTPEDVGQRRVLYVLKRYPRLSETFVVREIIAIERTGLHVAIDALLPAEDGPRHRDVAEVRATVRYVPRQPKLRHRDVARVHGRVARRAPLVWLSTARMARRDGTWRRFLQAGFVADRIVQEGIDHVHAHFATAAAEVARDAARLSGRPFSVTAHAKDIFHVDNAPKLARRVAGAAAVVTVSAYNERHLNAVLPKVPITHIANGVAVPVETSGPVAHGPVVCVSRLVEKKGIDTLLQAMAVLRSRPDTSETELVVVGGGDRRAEFEAMARELAVDTHVRFAGSLPFDEVEAIYRSASMVVLPCRVSTDGDRDGMPTVLVEALARALPVVSTDVVGIGELVIDAVTGRLVAPDDASALAGAIADLWVDPERCRTLGARGRQLVLDRFDPKASAASLATVFGAR